MPLNSQAFLGCGRYQADGPVASGDEDVIDANRRHRLHQSTGALVVTWEGAGGARACQFSQVPFVEIRGVTDTANHDAPSDFEMNLAMAMEQCCHFNHILDIPT